MIDGSPSVTTGTGSTATPPNRIMSIGATDAFAMSRGTTVTLTSCTKSSKLSDVALYHTDVTQTFVNAARASVHASAPGLSA